MFLLTGPCKLPQSMWVGTGSGVACMTTAPRLRVRSLRQKIKSECKHLASSHVDATAYATLEGCIDIIQGLLVSISTMLDLGGASSCQTPRQWAELTSRPCPSSLLVSLPVAEGHVVPCGKGFKGLGLGFQAASQQFPSSFHEASQAYRMVLS